MFFKVPVLLLLAFGFIGGILALPIPVESNAKRLARGLSPNPPKFLKRAGTPVSSKLEKSSNTNDDYMTLAI